MQVRVILSHVGVDAVHGIFTTRVPHMYMLDEIATVGIPQLGDSDFAIGVVCDKDGLRHQMQCVPPFLSFEHCSPKKLNLNTCV